MALFKRFFYRKPPDRLLEISERVYVFDCCFSTDVLEEDEYKAYIGSIIAQLQDHFPDSSFSVFNFKGGEKPTQISDILLQYDITVMEYPQQYNGCPLLPLEMIHHFLRSSESWLSLAGQSNVLLMHCEREGWPVLAFMLAALLLYRKQYNGELKTLEMVYKQAPRELLYLLSHLNPQPSQLRYLQYISRRNLGLEWPLSVASLYLDCLILRDIPLFDNGKGCRPVVHVYGHDPLKPASKSSKFFFSTSKTKTFVRYYQQAECMLVKIDIHCRVQGDVVLECIHLCEDFISEEMMFRIMFHTSFVRSNILMLSRDEIDILWNEKDHFPKDFKAEVLFLDTDVVLSNSTSIMVTEDLNETGYASPDEFYEVEEIFSSAVDTREGKREYGPSVVLDNTVEGRNHKAVWKEVLDPHTFQDCTSDDEIHKQDGRIDFVVQAVKDIAVDDVKYKVDERVDSDPHVVKDIVVDDGEIKSTSTMDTTNMMKNVEAEEVTKNLNGKFANIENKYDEDNHAIEMKLDSISKIAQQKFERQKLEKVLPPIARKQLWPNSKPMGNAFAIKQKTKLQEPQGGQVKLAKPNAITRWIPSNKTSYTNSMHVSYPKFVPPPTFTRSNSRKEKNADAKFPYTISTVASEVAISTKSKNKQKIHKLLASKSLDRLTELDSNISKSNKLKVNRLATSRSSDRLAELDADYTLSSRSSDHFAETDVDHSLSSLVAVEEYFQPIAQVWQLSSDQTPPTPPLPPLPQPSIHVKDSSLHVFESLSLQNYMSPPTPTSPQLSPSSPSKKVSTQLLQSPQLLLPPPTLPSFSEQNIKVYIQHTTSPPPPPPLPPPPSFVGQIRGSFLSLQNPWRSIYSSTTIDEKISNAQPLSPIVNFTSNAFSLEVSTMLSITFDTPPIPLQSPSSKYKAYISPPPLPPPPHPPPTFSTLRIPPSQPLSPSNISHIASSSQSISHSCKAPSSPPSPPSPHPLRRSSSPQSSPLLSCLASCRAFSSTLPSPSILPSPQLASFKTLLALPPHFSSNDMSTPLPPPPPPPPSFLSNAPSPPLLSSPLSITPLTSYLPSSDNVPLHVLPQLPILTNALAPPTLPTSLPQPPSSNALLPSPLINKDAPPLPLSLSSFRAESPQPLSSETLSLPQLLPQLSAIPPSPPLPQSYGVSTPQPQTMLLAPHLLPLSLYKAPVLPPPLPPNEIPFTLPLSISCGAPLSQPHSMSRASNPSLHEAPPPPLPPRSLSIMPPPPPLPHPPPLSSQGLPQPFPPLSSSQGLSLPLPLPNDTVPPPHLPPFNNPSPPLPPPPLSSQGPPLPLPPPNCQVPPPPPPPFGGQGPCPPSPPCAPTPSALPDVPALHFPNCQGPPLPPPPPNCQVPPPPPPSFGGQGLRPPSPPCAPTPPAPPSVPASNFPNCQGLPLPPPPPNCQVPPPPPPLFGGQGPRPPPPPCAPTPPAPLGAPAPPGPPAPPGAPAPPGGAPQGRGRGLSRLASAAPRRSSLKPLHWSKVSKAMKGSLWEEFQRHGEAQIAPEFDVSEIETIFSAIVPKPKEKSVGRCKSTGSKTDKVHLIDLKRANNTEIMLTKIKMPLSEMMAAVLALDDTILDADQVDSLGKYCPTKEEMELLKGYKGDKENLGKCEQYFLEQMKVPRVEAKLEAFSFKIQFNCQIIEFRKSLDTVNTACDEVRNSDKLKEIMKKILFLGNTLNQGTARGSAVGFKLDSLLKLSDTRAANSRMTLMHYLCKVLAEKSPALLDFHLDLVSLEVATKIQLKSLAEEMQAIIKGLEKVKRELVASENDGPVSKVFCQTLKEFIDGAESEVESVTNLYSLAGKNADALALYFGEDPARCPFEQVTATLLNFIRLFRKAHEENIKQAEMEKKKAEKEVEMEKEKAKVEIEMAKAEIEIEKDKDKPKASYVSFKEEKASSVSIKEENASSTSSKEEVL